MVSDNEIMQQHDKAKPPKFSILEICPRDFDRKPTPVSGLSLVVLQEHFQHMVRYMWPFKRVSVIIEIRGSLSNML